MRLVFEEQKPRLGDTVDLDIYFHRAGVYLLGLVETVELAVLLEMLDRYSRKIHQAYRLRAPELFSDREIFVVCALEQLVLKLHAVNDGQECRVTAVIRPVGVDHANFCYRRVAVLGFEIILAERNVVRVHGKTVFFDEVLKSRSVEFDKSVESSDFGRDIVFYRESLGLFETCLARLDGVDDIFLYPLRVGVGDVADEDVYFRRAYQRALALRDYLDALSRRVGALVELTGQEFDGKALAVYLDAVRHNVELRLGEHGALCVVKKFGRDVFRIVAVDNAHIGEILDSEQVSCLAEQGFCLLREFFFLFDEYSVYHLFFLPCGERFRDDVVPVEGVFKMNFFCLFVCRGYCLPKRIFDRRHAENSATARHELAVFLGGARDINAVLYLIGDIYFISLFVCHGIAL